jgi:hypothetical protein
MVWVLVAVLRALVGLVGCYFIDSYLVELSNIVCVGQNETDIGLVKIWT